MSKILNKKALFVLMVFLVLSLLMFSLTVNQDKVNANSEIIWSFDFETAPDSYFGGSYSFEEGEYVIDGSKSLKFSGEINVNTGNLITIPSAMETYVSFDIRFVGRTGNINPVFIACESDTNVTLGHLRINIIDDIISIGTGDNAVKTDNCSLDSDGVSHVEMKFTSASVGNFTYFKIADIGCDTVMDNFVISSASIMQDTIFIEEDFETNTINVNFNGNAELGNKIINGKSLKFSEAISTNGVASIAANSIIYVQFDVVINASLATQPVIIIKDTVTDTTLGYYRIVVSGEGVLSSQYGEGAVQTDKTVLNSKGISHIEFTYTSSANNTYFKILDVSNCTINLDNFVVSNYALDYVPKIVEEKEQQTIIDDIFDNETAKSLAYTFSGGTLVDEESGAISGKSLCLNSTVINTQPNIIFDKGVKITITMDLKFDNDISQFIVIGRNYGGNYNDGSNGYIRVTIQNSEATKWEAGEGAAYINTPILANGVYTVTFTFTTSALEDSITSYLLLQSNGGICIIDNLKVTQDKTEITFDCDTVAEENFTEGENLFDSEVLKPENTNMVATYSEGAAVFKFEKNILNAYENAFMDIKYSLPASNYQLSMEITENGIGRFLFGIYKVSNNSKIGTFLFATQSLAVFSDSVNIGEVVKNGDKYFITLTFNASERWYMRACAYQSDTTRNETNPATFSMSNFVIKSNITSELYELNNYYYQISSRNLKAYSTETANDVTSALNVASVLINKTDVTPQEVFESNNSLKTAVKNLVLLIDKTELEIVIDTAKSYKEDKYTSVSFLALTQAIKNAETVLEKSDASQSEVDLQKTTLNQAIVGLVEKEITKEKEETNSGCKAATLSIDFILIIVFIVLAFFSLKINKIKE